MGYKIKEARELKNMTQESLSKESGISRTIISGLESGNEVVTTTATLRSLAVALGVKVSDIFFD